MVAHPFLKDAAKTAKAATAQAGSPPAVKKDKVQAGLAKAAIRAAVDGYPVYSVSSDVQGSTGIAPFQKTFPERYIEVGIAEANMVSTGAGLSKAGFIPIVDTFGQFGVTKGNLPLTMAALSQAGVIALLRQLFARVDGPAEQRAATDQNDIGAFLEQLRFVPVVLGIFHPVDRIVFAANEEDVVVGIFPGPFGFGVLLDGCIHQRFGFIRAGRRDDVGMRDRREGGEVGRGLV